MRKFSSNSFSDREVDLDDPKTFDYLPDSINELREIMFSKIGYAYCYLNYRHKDYLGNRKINGKQIRRIEKLVKNFTENELDNLNNIMWFKEQIFLFQDEIENLC